MARIQRHRQVAGRMKKDHRIPIARVPRSQGTLGRLFPSSGLRAQARRAIRLARSTPGLTVYLGGGLAVWLLTRALVGHGLAESPLGALAVGALRLLGLALVTALYFRRTGHLVLALIDLRRLRRLLAERPPWQSEPSAPRRRLIRLLRWSLRVRE